MGDTANLLNLPGGYSGRVKIFLVLVGGGLLEAKCAYHGSLLMGYRLMG